MKKSMFITLEGPDGCGKSSVALELKKELINLGYSIVHTREPGGIEISEQIREVILNKDNTAMAEKTEALLYAASRCQHIQEKIIPALESGQIIICERFLDSSLAYQGYARNIGIDAVYDINKFAIGTCMPDLTLFLDIEPSLGLERIKSRQNKDRLDQEKIDFHQKVYQGYQKVNQLFSKRIKIVDASKPLNEVVEKCLELIVEKL